MSLATERLTQERKNLRKNKPFGFYAKPVKSDDGTLNLFKWECGIPGPKNSDWEGGLFKVVLSFTEGYPAKPPRAKFTPPIFHPNVYLSGEVCLSLLEESRDWAASLTIRDVLIGLQTFLVEPNNASAAHPEAYRVFKASQAKYKLRIQEQAKKFAETV